MLKNVNVCSDLSNSYLIRKKPFISGAGNRELLLNFEIAPVVTELEYDQC